MRTHQKPRRMNGLKASLTAAAVALAAGLFLASFSPQVGATLKYKKETGKKCIFCHTGIPKPGDEDPQLNADGKKFKENGYKLTEEQKQKPDPKGR